MILCSLLLSACSLLSNNKLPSKLVPEGSLYPEGDTDKKTELPLASLTTSIEPSVTHQPNSTPTADIIQTLLPGSNQPETNIQEYEPEKWTLYHMGSEDLPIMMVYDIASGPNGVMWIASSQGLTRIDREKLTTFTEKDGLICNEAYSVAVENNGVVWVGTEKGVSMFDGNTWQSYTTDNGLQGNYIRSISIDNNETIWFVSENRSDNDFQYWITSYDGDTWTSFSSDDGLPSGRLYSIIGDQKGNMWVGTEHGIALYDGSSWSVFHRDDYWETTYNYLDEAVSSLSLAPDGTIWFLTDSIGLTNYDGYQWKNVAHPSLFSIYLSSITAASNNDVWVCGADGSKEHYHQLILFTGADWIVYEIPLTSWCFDVFAPKDGSIWIATEVSIMRYEQSR